MGVVESKYDVLPELPRSSTYASAGLDIDVSVC